MCQPLLIARHQGYKDEQDFVPLYESLKIQWDNTYTNNFSTLINGLKEICTVFHRSTEEDYLSQHGGVENEFDDGTGADS